MKPLVCYYDLFCCPTSYDIVSFLMLIERHRHKMGVDSCIIRIIRSVGQCHPRCSSRAIQIDPGAAAVVIDKRVQPQPARLSTDARAPRPARD